MKGGEGGEGEGRGNVVVSECLEAGESSDGKGGGRFVGQCVGLPRNLTALRHCRGPGDHTNGMAMEVSEKEREREGERGREGEREREGGREEERERGERPEYSWSAPKRANPKTSSPTLHWSTHFSPTSTTTPERQRHTQESVCGKSSFQQTHWKNLRLCVGPNLKSQRKHPKG
jgi:hypothetical protein